MADISEEKMETSRSHIGLANLVATVWIILATVSCWLINPLYAWAFLGFTVFSIYTIVRRLTCNSCYYCKSCTKGFAKLSRLFIGKSHIPGISKGSEIGMTSFLYVVLTVIPSTLLVSAIIQNFNPLALLLLISLLVISTGTGIAHAKNNRTAANLLPIKQRGVSKSEGIH